MGSKVKSFGYLNQSLFGNTMPNIRFNDITIRLNEPDRKNVTGKVKVVV